MDRVTDYTGPERRRDVHLSDEQINEIAERAATRALEKLAAGASKGAFKWLSWVFGTVVAGLLIWLAGGKLP